MLGAVDIDVRVVSASEVTTAARLWSFDSCWTGASPLESLPVLRATADGDNTGIDNNDSLATSRCLREADSELLSDGCGRRFWPLVSLQTQVSGAERQKSRIQNRNLHVLPSFPRVVQKTSQSEQISDREIRRGNSFPKGGLPFRFLCSLPEMEPLPSLFVLDLTSLSCQGYWI